MPQTGTLVSGTCVPRGRSRQRNCVTTVGHWGRGILSLQLSFEPFNKHHSKKKTATLKLVSLRHNPPPPHPVFTTNPFPLPHPPGSTTINFPHLELHWPFRCTLGCWTGCFCYCHLSRFSFSSQRTEKFYHKNHGNFGVFQSRVVCFKMSESYMGVSLNGGTPKTPQKDHF